MASCDPYDIVITRRDGDSFGYVADWGAEDPIMVTSEPPELSVSTSAGLTTAGGDFSGRDAAPPYPIATTNWQDGAGQNSYDTAKATPDAFKASKGIDVSDDGEFKLGPWCMLFPDTDVLNICGVANGAVYASWTPSGSDPRKQLRVLGRYVCTSASGSGSLQSTSDTTFSVTDATALASAVGSPAKVDATYDIAIGDFLFCPKHRELVKVTNVAGTALTVTRGVGGTTASAHEVGESETWYGFKWYPIYFDGADPAQRVTSVCSHGGYVYAAFHTPTVATNNGSVWRGLGYSTDDPDGWENYAATNNITALASCAGYLCGVQENYYGTNYTTTAGYWDTTGTWVGASVAAATSSDQAAVATNALSGKEYNSYGTVGFVAINNYVYWVTTDGYGRSFVYRYQPAVAASFSLVAELPYGFTATCAASAAGYLYVGGYTDMQVVDPDNAVTLRYKGAMYAVYGDSEVAPLASFGEIGHDYRVKGLVSAGPYVYILTNEDVRVWSLEHAGWWHYSDISIGSTSGETGDIDWESTGFSYDPTDSDGVEPDDTGSCTGAYTVMTRDTSASPALVVTDGDSWSDGSTTYPLLHVPDKVFTCASKKWARYTVDGIPSNNIGTLEAKVGCMRSAAGNFVIAGTSKEARVRCYSPSDNVLKFSLGSWDGSDYSWTYTGDFVNYAVAATSSGGVITLWREYQQYIMRLTMDTTEAVLYINGNRAMAVPYDELKTVTGADATKAWFSVGWPDDDQTNVTSERIGVSYVKFVPGAAYSPDYMSTPTTANMKGITALHGDVLVPAPGVGVNMIDPRFKVSSGWLESSDSSFHTGSVEKYFSGVTVAHTDLASGQSINVQAYVDGVLAGSTANSTQGSTSTQLVLSSTGKRIRTIVSTTDTYNDVGMRNPSYELKVQDVTARFFPQNSLDQLQLKLTCRNNVVMSNGQKWDCDPDEAVRHVREIVRSGEVCSVKMMWDDFDARIEGLKFTQGKGDSQVYNKLVGDMRISLREVNG